MHLGDQDEQLLAYHQLKKKQLNSKCVLFLEETFFNYSLQLFLKKKTKLNKQTKKLAKLQCQQVKIYLCNYVCVWEHKA